MRIVIALAICSACFAAERAPLSKVEAAAEAYIRAVAAAASAVPEAQQGKQDSDAGATPESIALYSQWSATKRKAKQMQEGDLAARIQYAQECMVHLYGYYSTPMPLVSPAAREMNPRQAGGR